jgi:hypothetical protein
VDSCRIGLNVRAHVCVGWGYVGNPRVVLECAQVIDCTRPFDDWLGN